MTTAFKVVQDAIKTLLLQAPQITGPRVNTGRARPLPTEQANDISVSLESIGGQQFALGAGPINWQVTYGIEIRARGTSTVDAVSALDPLLEAAFARIGSNAPPSGVMGWVLDPRIRIDVEEASTPIGTLQLALNVQLRTQPGSLTLAA